MPHMRTADAPQGSRKEASSLSVLRFLPDIEGGCEEASMSVCRSCGDQISPDKECDVPGCKRPKDRRCSACHNELTHGCIPNVTGDGRLGGNPRGSRLKEPSPWGENNVRTMEGETA